MKNHSMSMAFVTSLAFIAGSTGCAVSSPAPETDSAPEASGETILMNEEDHTILDGVTLRIERRDGESTFSLAEGSDWQIVAPGVWESPTEDGNMQRVAVGEEGHRWLVEQAVAELDALHALRAAEEMTPGLAEKIATAEEMLLTTQQQMMSAAGGTSLLPASCNIALYTGPSSPVTSPPVAGAAALAQIACSGGCATFTVTSQACCSSSCSNVSAFTKTVCATPWTAGTIRSGWGFGAAAVNVTPPNVTQSNSSFYCQ